jgi:hypothetical protein
LKLSTIRRKVLIPLMSITLILGFLSACDAKTATTEPAQGKICNSTKQGELLPPQLPTSTPPPVHKTPVGTVQPEPTLDLTQLSTRAGFGLAQPADPEFWAAALKSGWYLSWDVEKRTPDQLPEHWQTVQVGINCFYPDSQYLQWAAAKFPGNIWIIGNEPDVIWQNNVTPEEYAGLYHDSYQAIKSADPTAKVAVGGISQATPLRLEYLNRVLAEYQRLYHTALPTDWWTLHGYVLNEQRKSWGVEIPPGFTVDQGTLREVKDHGRLDLFEEQIIAFRRWMTANGYRNSPLALTEFGILMPPNYGFSPDIVIQYLNSTFTWLQNTVDESIGYPSDSNHLVQRWAWFSLAFDLYPSPNLADLSTKNLTPIGQAFRDYVLTYHP